MDSNATEFFPFITVLMFTLCTYDKTEQPYGEARGVSSSLW